ncbi:MAG: zinc-dependent dehydrogenase [Thermoplasmata archaeon]|nr:MAG: zinc-dependent dehydrogenase [Thermoplasmata archaeon]
MRVAMYYNNNDVRLEEMPKPKIGSTEVLVEVHASGICGSDVMEWYRKQSAPRVLGHEITGVITEAGKDVDKFKVGDRVFVSHHVPCNTCHYCLNGRHSVCDTLRTTNYDPGGFAEYIRVPQINVELGVFRLPEGMSMETGVFVEPLACVLRGQNQLNLRPGNSVLVIGSGISGLLHIALAKAYGVERIIATDINDFRLEAAKKAGADVVLFAKEAEPERLRELNDGRLADYVILCTGAVSALKQSYQSCERGGSVLLFAPTEPGVEVPTEFFEIWKEGLTINTSYAGSPADIQASIDLLAAGRIVVDDMITHTLPLAETQRGFQLVAQAQDSIKVIIDPRK